MALQRVQRRRDKGWRLPEGVVVVTRPTKWGNPYEVRQNEDGRWEVWAPYSSSAGYPMHERLPSKRAACEVAVEELRRVLELDIGGFVGYPTLVEAKEELVGKSLACWCPISDDRGLFPCHADLLMLLANGGAG